MEHVPSLPVESPFAVLCWDAIGIAKKRYKNGAACSMILL